MLHSGPAFSVTPLDDGIVEVKFDLAGESVNKINALALQDFAAATQAIANDTGVKGIILTSGKGVFVVGADITEFGRWFADGPDAIVQYLDKVHQILARFEDLQVPSVAAINGICLGGGLEMCLACDYRVMSTTAKIGLPEVKLGIYPGFGGTVRLPRLIGLDNAVEWIATGKDRKAEDALKVGAVDAVVAPEKLQEAALGMVRSASPAVRLEGASAPKNSRRSSSTLEQMMAFKTAKGFVAAQAGPNYPAPGGRDQDHAERRDPGRDKALAIEAKVSRKLQTRRRPSADRPVPERSGGEEGCQRVRRKVAQRTSRRPCSAPASWAAVSLTSRPSRDADRHEGHPRGRARARHDGSRQAADAAGRAGQEHAGENGRNARPHSSDLELRRFRQVDLVVEAVVENPKVKKAVFAEVEAAGQRGHDPRVQHLDHLDHHAGRRPASVRRTSSACTSSIRCT